MQVISFQLLLQASHKHNYHSLANGGQSTTRGCPLPYAPRQARNTRHEHRSKAVQTRNGRQCLPAKCFDPGYDVSLTFQNILELDIAYP